MLKTICYSLLIILWLSLWFGSEVFAQAADVVTTSYADEVMKVLTPILSFFSWSWIILANLAGALMSNELIYGSVFWLDVFLWQIWWLMRTFANFLIGFGLLWIIVQEVFQFGQSDPLNTVSSKIKNFIIAAVGINVSWFVIWALIDISTIIIATVWSFPSIFIAGDSTPLFNQISLQSMKEQLPKSIVMDMSNKDNQWWVKRVPYATGEITSLTDEQFLDYIMPAYNSLWWPLTFIWASILRLQDFGTLNKQETVKGVSISIIVRIWVVVLFSIALIVLVVVNLMRIWFIWMIVALSPLIIVIQFLWKDLWFWDNILPESMKREKLVDYIFRPVIVTMCMSIMLIVVVSMSQLMISNERADVVLWWTSFKNNSMTIDGLTNMETKWDILPDMVDGTKQGIVWLLLVMLTLYLMYLLIQISVSGSSIPFVNTLVGAPGTASGLITRWLWSIPIIPGIGLNGKAWGVNLASRMLDTQLDVMKQWFKKWEQESERALTKFWSYLSWNDQPVRYSNFVDSKSSIIRDLNSSGSWSTLNTWYLDALKSSGLNDLKLDHWSDMGTHMTQWIKKSIGQRLSVDISIQKQYKWSDGNSKDTDKMTLQELYWDAQGKVLLHAIYYYLKNGKFPKQSDINPTLLSYNWNQFKDMAIM